MLAEREAELAALRAAMDGLEAGLRGPWRPGDAVLEERLNAILRIARHGRDPHPRRCRALARRPARLDHSRTATRCCCNRSRRSAGAATAIIVRGVSWSVSDRARPARRMADHRGAQPSQPCLSRRLAIADPPARRLVAVADRRVPAERDRRGRNACSASMAMSRRACTIRSRAESVERWQAIPRQAAPDALGMLRDDPDRLPRDPLARLCRCGLGVIDQALGDRRSVRDRLRHALSVILFTLSRWRLRWQARLDDHPRWQREGWLAAYARACAWSRCCCRALHGRR